MWPSATSTSGTDRDYEVIGASVFRFEYCYLLQSGSFSTTPWDTAVGSTSLDGLRDVAAILCTIAVLDPRSRALADSLPPTIGLPQLVGELEDFTPTTLADPALLHKQWRATIDRSTLPRTVSSAIHIYQRAFALHPPRT